MDYLIFVCTNLNFPEIAKICQGIINLFELPRLVYLNLGLKIESRIGLRLVQVGKSGQNKAKFWFKLAQIGSTWAKWTSF